MPPPPRVAVIASLCTATPRGDREVTSTFACSLRLFASHRRIWSSRVESTCLDACLRKSTDTDLTRRVVVRRAYSAHCVHNLNRVQSTQRDTIGDHLAARTCMHTRASAHAPDVKGGVCRAPLCATRAPAGGDGIVSSLMVRDPSGTSFPPTACRAMLAAPLPRPLACSSVRLFSSCSPLLT